MKEKRPVCGKVMIPSAQHALDERERKFIGLKQVRCTLDPGHEGNHSCKTKTASYEWWNEEKNPQREAR